MRFRQRKFPITADLRKYYLSVHLPKEDSDFMRFFFYEDPKDPKSPVVEYRVTTHIFGGIWSQSVAGHAIEQTIQEALCNDEITEKEAKEIRRSLYSDDYVRSFDTVVEAVQSALQLVKMLKRSGFHLAKFASTESAILEKIPPKLRHPNIEDLDFKGKLENVLGITWCIEDDTFRFAVDPDRMEDLTTRRKLLGCGASVFDPNGWMLFITTPAKLLIQQSFRDQNKWDEPLSNLIMDRVEEWKNKTATLHDLHIPRRLNTFNCDDSALDQQLHTFCDASEFILAAIAYLRTVSPDGRVEVRMIASRARLGPMKGLTIPRMELCGALLATRLAVNIRRELGSVFSSIHYWTDSASTLGYIRNTTKRFVVFTGNRISEIQSSTDINSWRYVPTDVNPADGLTRCRYPSNVHDDP